MSQTKQSPNTTHRKRLARLYAEATGLTYQQAHARVIAASEAGLLPTPLNPVGMYAALAVLADMEATQTAAVTGPTPDTDTDTNVPVSALADLTPSMDGWSTARRNREEARLLDLVDLRGGRAHIAGTVECLFALSLAEQNKIVIEDPAAITPLGGSGWIRKTGPALATADDVIAGRARYADTPGGHADRATLAAEAAERAEQHTKTPQTWFVAHEGNPIPRCTSTSWRGGSGARAGHGYGPGGFNRCVKAHGHAPEHGGTDLMHVDEWGNVFRLEPKFKVVRNISNTEMADIARESGMAVGTSGSFESKAEAMKPNTLWMTADNEMVKISTHYLDEGRITAQVVFPVPPRTTVRSYTLSAAAGWKSPSAAQVRKYERAWGFDD